MPIGCSFGGAATAAAVSVALLLWFGADGTVASGLSRGPHIADVNVLLPPRMTNPVEYRLQGSDGCFKWSWDHHDILSVTPEYNASNRCSTSARLRSIAPYSGRKETAIYATDMHTGVVIRCKVFIDIFSRFQIFHSSVKLDLDGLATLRLRAFDVEENVFSSLVGLQFLWQLKPETSGLPHHLVHVPLRDSPLSDCGGMCGDLDVQIKLEDKGVFSDLFVVKGVGIGHEAVSVYLAEPEMEHMADEILLTVAEAMSIEPPSPVFVLVGATVHYTLKVIRGNMPQAIALPSPHHRWSTLNSSVADMATLAGVARAMNLGSTTVVVEDVRVAGHIQGSSLHVVVPDVISLLLLPLSESGESLLGLEGLPSITRWYVVSGRLYVVQIKAFSGGPDAEEIYLTESENWILKSVSDDILQRHGWKNSYGLDARLPGLGKLMASLAYFSENHKQEVLKVVQEIMVCEKVLIILDNRTDSHSRIVLPSSHAIYQEMQLKAAGGCAKAATDYKWFSSDMSILSVSTVGVIQAKKPGSATIKVQSVFDSLNYDEVSIEVSLPASMVMLQTFPVETVVGSYIEAAVTLKTSDGSYFYRCDAFDSFIKWKTGSESFVVVKERREDIDYQRAVPNDMSTLIDGPPCSHAIIYATGIGQAMLHATLPKDYYDFDTSGSTTLKASLRVAAYPPLVLLQQGDGNRFGGYWYDFTLAETDERADKLDKVFLVPGTHLDVALIGGPEKWDSEADFIETVEVRDEDGHFKGQNIVERLHGNGSLYRISCQVVGAFRLTFKRGNLAGIDHQLPAIVEALMSLTCSFPSSIVVIADEPVNEKGVIQSAALADRVWERVRATPITVANGRTIRLAAVGVSNSREAFANCSSLRLRWELCSCDGLAYWPDTVDSERSQSSWERFLVLQNRSGSCIVRAAVIGSHQIMSAHGTVQSLEGGLTDAVKLQLVSSLRVYPEYSLLFFNPNARVNLSISGGSCLLEPIINDTQIVELLSPPPGFQCLQLTLSPLDLGTAEVTVKDLGLVPPLSASAVVQVAEIDWVKVASREEIRLMEENSLVVEIVAGTHDGRTFDRSQFMYMDLHVHVGDPIVEIIDQFGLSSPTGGSISDSSFKIVGKHLGFTNLYVSAKQRSGNDLRSAPIKIEIYAQPRIHPEEIFVAPGASFVVTVRGGPTAGAHIKYHTIDNTIISIQETTGRLSAISPGKAVLLATIYDSENIVVCQTNGSVNVVVPTSVVLHMQSEQLGVGRNMPIYPLFHEGGLFSLHELCRNYNWSLENEKIFGFRSAELLDDGYQLTSVNQIQYSHMNDPEVGFMRILHGRSAGKAKISISFSCDFVSPAFSASRFYSTTTLLSVVPDPPLSLGVPITWILPPNYVTSVILPSSLGPYSKLDGHSWKGSVVYSLLRSCNAPNEFFPNDTLFLEDGRIRTSKTNELACIQAKDRETGRTEVASCVRVTEVSQVRFSDKEFPSHLVHVALGAEVKLSVSHYDALGNAFFEAHGATPFNLETNHADIVSINISSHAGGCILLKAVRHGTALVQLSIDGKPRKSDYILISVGGYIFPQNPVIHVGGLVTFCLQGFEEQVSGHWMSVNESIVSVDRFSGKTEAIDEGTTLVIFQSPTVKLQTSVTVLRGDLVSVDAPGEALSNQPFPLRGYEFPVKFRSPYGNTLQALRNGKEIPFDCSVDPSFIGYAKPWVNMEAGDSYCLFFPYSPEHLVLSMPRSKDIRPDVSISVKATMREAKNASGSASAMLVGGFSILGMGKDHKRLNMTPNLNKTILTLVGNTDVEINWQGLDVMRIAPISREGYSIWSRTDYEVAVLSAKSFTDKIVITLPATGQRMEVDVHYIAKESKLPVYSARPANWLGMLVSFVLLLVILGISFFLLKRPQGTRSSIPPATPIRSAAAVPDYGSSPSTIQEMSPRTPPAFVEYVRRTVDESPYYRREGARRRFNPQNTY
ncbi:hypothetical protein MLD38_022689 [Melastoma candidum]|uniref:Uncharacterized protein n=1 Tax=Melastoma candidum TaxID=119954 RepID=A0ACB9QLA2_9MYRT|nr:hypothetical protein MLD38_022689 [Melastoma candidum]